MCPLLTFIICFAVTQFENPDIDHLVATATQQQQTTRPLLFDTAERYGTNWKTALGVWGWGETERWLGEYYQQQQQQHTRMTVATKFTPSPWRTTVQSVLDACDASRQRLGVDTIDLYQLHMPDIFFHDKGGSSSNSQTNNNNNKNAVYWEGLAECYHRGWVQNVGVSNYGPTLLAECQEALEHRGVPLASNQIAYSLLGRHNGAQATLDYCRRNDIAVLACFPLAMGLLTGKYNGVRSSSSTGPSQKSRLEQRDLRSYSRQMDTFMRVVQGIATAREKTVSQVALNYVQCKGAIPIPGARTAAQAMDNLGAMGWELTPVEVQTLEAAAAGDTVGFAGFDGAGFKRASEKFVGYGMEAWALD